MSHESFEPYATIFRRHVDLCPGPSKIGGAKQVSLRSSAEEDSHLRPTGRPSLGEGFGKSGNRGNADSAGHHNDARHRTGDLEGIAERTERPKKPSRTHRCQQRGAATVNLVEDLHLSNAKFRVSSSEFRVCMKPLFDSELGTRNLEPPRSGPRPPDTHGPRQERITP